MTIRPPSGRPATGATSTSRRSACSPAARPADRPHGQRHVHRARRRQPGRPDRVVGAAARGRGAGRVGDGGAGVDRARAAHVRADRRGGQLLLHRAVVPQAGRARRHGLEHAPVPRRHRVLRRLRRLRRANHRAARLGRGRHRARARAARHAKGHDDASLCAGRRPRLRVDHQPRLRREDGDLRAPDACRAPNCGCCCSPSTSVRPSGTSPRRGRRSSTTASGSGRIPTATSRSSIRPGRAAPAAWSTRRCSPRARAGSRRRTSGIPKA